MKREPDSASDDTGDTSPPAAKKNKMAPKKAAAPERPATPKPKSPASPKVGKAGAWTNDQRARLLEFVIAEGARAANLDVIAAELGVSRSQVQDQLKANRRNLRRAVLDFVKNEK